MELTLDQLLKGKQTKIKDKTFFPTAAYVEPFLERVSKLTDDFRIQAILPTQITYTKEGEIDLEDQTFNRVWIQAVLPDVYPVKNHSNVIGMVYGLDVKKPVFKVYRGGLNQACTNLCVFSNDMLSCQEIESETPINYKSLDRIIKDTDDSFKFITQLLNTPFDKDVNSVNEQLGSWIRNCIDYSYAEGFGKVKVATSSPIEAFKYLFKDPKSGYYIEDKEASMYDVYGAFTQTITNNLKKDIMNQVEKTLLVKSILGI